MPRTRDKIIREARKLEPTDHLGRPLASYDEVADAWDEKGKKREKKVEEKDASR